MATWPLTYEPWWDRCDGLPTCVRVNAHEGRPLDAMVLTPIGPTDGWDATIATFGDVVRPVTDPDERARLEAELSAQVLRRGGLRAVWRTNASVPRWYELVAHRAGAATPTLPASWTAHVVLPPIPRRPSTTACALATLPAVRLPGAQGRISASQTSALLKKINSAASRGRKEEPCQPRLGDS